MELKHLIAFEKWTCLLAVVVLACGLIFCDRHAALSLSLGAGLMSLNAWSIRQIGERFGAALRARPGVGMLLFNIKMGLLIAICYVLITHLGIDPKFFTIGISVLPVAIVIVALQHGLRREDNT